jgi:hypothetical protein
MAVELHCAATVIPTLWQQLSHPQAGCVMSTGKGENTTNIEVTYFYYTIQILL